MLLHELKPKTPRQKSKRVGRGGKKGTTSGHGTKGQKSRAGSYVRPGFRGGDNRLWQLFPKLRGASKKPGSNRPHKKHRFYRLHQTKPAVVNLGELNAFQNGDTVNLKTLAERGLIESSDRAVKILGTGELSRKLTFEGVTISGSAKEKAEKAGSVVK